MFFYCLLVAVAAYIAIVLLPAQVFIFCAIACACIARLFGSSSKQVLMILLVMLMIYITAGFYQQANQFPWSHKNQVIQLELTINDLLADGKLKTSFMADHLTLAQQSLARDKKILLSWYGQNRPRLQPNMRCQLQVKLKPARSTFNFVGFNREQAWFAQRVVAKGYVKFSPKNHCWLPAKNTSTLQEYLRHRLDHQLRNMSQAGIIKAMLFGSKQQIPQAQLAVYRDSGTAHLLVISGLHVSLVAMFAATLVSFVWRRSYYLSNSFSTKTIAVLSGILAAFGYCSLAGFALPAQRALLMLICAALPWICWRQLPQPVAYLLAMAVVLILEPLAPLSASFWLSFMAVAFILLANFSNCRGLFYKIPLVMAGLMAILGGYYFHQVSVIAPLANFLAVPWTSFVILPLSLLAMILGWFSDNLASLLFVLVNDALSLQAWCLMQLLQVPHGVLTQVYLSTFEFILLLIWFVILILPRALPGKYIAVMAIALIMFRPIARPASGELWVRVIDVGQGLSVLIQSRHANLLFDAGPRFASNIILPYLSQQKIQSLDMVLSHLDEDHKGGAEPILQTGVVEQLYSNEPFLDYPTEPCHAGLSWQIDGFTFEFVHPQPTDRNLSRNNRSCVLKIYSSSISILLTGDVEQLAEQKIVQRGHQLEADVLLVAHHGSKTSSSASFLQAVKPKLAIVSSGYLNRYHFPHPSVVARYQKFGIELLNTAQAGAILLKIGHNGKISRRMARAGNYWWQQEG